MATLSWDMKADKSSRSADGVDTLAYAYGADGAGQTLELARRLPAVAKGGYVPPPFATVVARILDEDGNVTAEFPATVDIPQYVQVMWDAAALAEFHQPLEFAYPGTDDANYEGQRRTDALFNLSCLAQISGGAYFNAYYSSATNQWNRDAIHWVSKVILPAPLARIIPKPNAHRGKIGEYDKWQDILIARFKSQLASGDAEIADTIYTMGFIRSDRAMPLLIDNLTACPQVSTNAPSGFAFPAAEALVSIAPPLGICFEKLEATASMSPEESLWLRIAHEDYPEALEYDLMKKAETGDARAKRLLQALPWRRLEKE